MRRWRASGSHASSTSRDDPTVALVSGSNLLAAAGGLRFGSPGAGSIESREEGRLRAVSVGVGDQLDGFLVVDPVEAHEDDRVVVVVAGGDLVRHDGRPP